MTCQMTFEELKRSLSYDKPPNRLSRALIALWWAAKGEWARTHETAQEDEGEPGPWVDAYLHRKDGDQDKDPRLRSGIRLTELKRFYESIEQINCAPRPTPPFFLRMKERCRTREA